MKVAEIMKRDLHVVSPDVTVAEAVEQIVDARVHGLPVVDARGRLIGVISATDVMLATAEAASPQERERVFEHTLVGEIMTPRPATVLPETDVLEAARHLLYLDVQRLFVEDEGQLAGVISQSDIVAALATARI